MMVISVTPRKIRDEPEDRSGCDRYRHDGDADQQGQPRPVDQPG
jgi:hypothetical protein